MTVHQPTAAVRKSFSEAQQQAAAMVTGAPAPWNEATRAQRRSPLWIGVAAASVVAGGVAGWLGVDWFNAPTRAVSPTSPDAIARVIAPPPPTPPPASTFAPVVTPIAAPPSLAVTRQVGVIRIASTNASLADAVRALAQATHTNVKGGEALASITTPITLNWKGNDTAAAWDALLGRFASVAVSCVSTACELWIVGINAPRAASSLPATGATTAPGEPAQPARPVVQAAPAPAPSSEENTETN